MLVELMKPDFCLDNEKGSLVQLVHDGWKQINVIWSPKDSIRGNHYHKYNEEAFYLINGKIKLILSNNKEEEIVIFQAGDMFKIPPFVNHIFEYLEDTTLVSMYSNGVELGNNEMDIFQY